MNLIPLLLLIAAGDTGAMKTRRRLSSAGSDSEFSVNSSPSCSSEESASTGGSVLTIAGVSKQKTLKRPRSKKPRPIATSTLDNKSSRMTVSGATSTAAATATSKYTDNGTKTRKVQQQWTELTAVCHVFSDEVYKYIYPVVEEDVDQQQQKHQRRKKKQPPHLSIGEKKQLNSLVESVRDRVDRQSAVVLDNRKLVKAAKAAKCKVRDLRNDIMITRLLTGKLEAEVLSLEKQVRRRKGDQMKAEQASRFLSAIETLAQRR